MRRLLVAITTLLCLAMPASALAYNPLDTACESPGVDTTSTCTTDGTDPLSGPNGALKKISLIIAGIAGLAAVIVIMFAGFQFVTAGNDPQKVTNARNMIVGAIIGLVIIAAAESIILFVVSKL